MLTALPLLVCLHTTIVRKAINSTALVGMCGIYIDLDYFFFPELENDHPRLSTTFQYRLERPQYSLTRIANSNHRASRLYRETSDYEAAIGVSVVLSYFEIPGI